MLSNRTRRLIGLNRTGIDSEQLVKVHPRLCPEPLIILSCRTLFLWRISGVVNTLMTRLILISFKMCRLMDLVLLLTIMPLWLNHKGLFKKDIMGPFVVNTMLIWHQKSIKWTIMPTPWENMVTIEASLELAFLWIRKLIGILIIKMLMPLKTTNRWRRPLVSINYSKCNKSTREKSGTVWRSMTSNMAMIWAAGSSNHLLDLIAMKGHLWPLTWVSEKHWWAKLQLVVRDLLDLISLQMLRWS